MVARQKEGIKEGGVTTSDLPACRCPLCREPGEHPELTWHRQLILVIRRLDEQQRRWVAAMEANRLGWGGETLVSQITGLDEKTIRRGKEELAAALVDRPLDRVRLPGGGRPAVEKKIPPSA